MSKLDELVHCTTHGPSDFAFVCIHIGDAMNTSEKVGFFWSDPMDEFPAIAWCNSCESWLLQHEEEWTEVFEQQADFKLICSACYEEAKTLNLGS